MWLRLVALLFLVIAATGEGDIHNGNYDIIDVSIATPFTGCHISYTALVYSAPTGQIRVRPDAPTATAHGWYGTDFSSRPRKYFNSPRITRSLTCSSISFSAGLTELQCGSCIIRTGSDGELLPPASHAHGIPTFSVPLSHAADFPVAEFVLRAHWTS